MMPFVSDLPGAVGGWGDSHVNNTLKIPVRNYKKDTGVDGSIESNAVHPTFSLAY